MAKLKGKLGCTINLTIRYCTPSVQPDMSKIDRKLWISDVVTPQSCSRKWGKRTKQICEETSFLFWFFLKLGRRAHHDRFFPTFGIILGQTSLRQQLFKVSNIRNGIHCMMICREQYLIVSSARWLGAAWFMQVWKNPKKGWQLVISSSFIPFFDLLPFSLKKFFFLPTYPLVKFLKLRPHQYLPFSGPDHEEGRCFRRIGTESTRIAKSHIMRSRHGWSGEENESPPNKQCWILSGRHWEELSQSQRKDRLVSFTLCCRTR